MQTVDLDSQAPIGAAPAGGPQPAVGGAGGVRIKLRNLTPASYRWWKHVLLVALFTTGGLLISLAVLPPLSAGPLVFSSLCLLFLNFGEYATHRWNMHVLRWPRPVHYRHVVEHHAFFTYEQMAVDDIADLRWVLFPPWALPLLVASVLPFFILLWLIAPDGWAGLFLASVVVYYGLYELLHALAHLPEHHPIGGARLVRALTHHHRLHHDPRLMDRYNFNFVVPLWDWIFGTAYRLPASTGMS